MISEQSLRYELKRLPGIMKRYIKEGNLEEALEIKRLAETLDWVLNADEEDQ